MNLTEQIGTGPRVRDLRRRQRWSQQELSVWLCALRAPITRDMIANWETGRSEVPTHFIPILAYALRARVKDILPDLTLKDVKAGRIASLRGNPRRKPRLLPSSK